jgi:hypothetical protein
MKFIKHWSVWIACLLVTLRFAWQARTRKYILARKIKR